MSAPTTATPASARMPTSVEKTLKVLQALAGHEVQGLAPGELATRTGVAPSWLSQVMPALEQAAWVERTESGRWRLGPAPVRIGLTTAQHLQRASADLAALAARYLPNNP